VIGVLTPEGHAFSIGSEVAGSWDWEEPTRWRWYPAPKQSKLNKEVKIKIGDKSKY